MNKKLISALIVSTALVVLTACSSAKQEPKTAPATQPAAPAAQVVEPGKIAFDYPVAESTTAKAGDYVLVPSSSTIKSSLEKGGKDTVFIFYAAKMVEPGSKESKVEDLTGDKFSAPNALIVPIKSGETAAKGDLVLTWWQSGSGMTKGFVTEAGKTPKVVYSDGSTKGEDTLKENTFHKLTGELEAGATVAAKDGSFFNHGVVINVSGDKVLVNGFAGFMTVYNKSDVTPMPVKLEVKAGDKVMAPVIGSYKEVTVKSVKADKGQFEGEYDWAGEKTTETFYFGEVISKL
ncbi:hypothetical protein HZC20_01570 [Candidatus Peregrinibacteria bacterium]|nr:hypothetical protein [Candidatus Peregrinibacteria bacterium]